MISLKSIELKQRNNKVFPFDLPFFGSKIQFNSPIVILVGENGSGKSTLIELIHQSLNLVRIRSKSTIFQDEAIKLQAKDMNLTYHLQKPKGFFFSAEDFTSYIHELERQKIEAEQELKRVERDYQNKSALSKSLASMPHARTLHEIENLHEKDLLKSSHGEAYLDFFKSRMRKHELYLLDEPETPLSIQNQLALISIIDQSVRDDNQFIIATHSPVIMAIPYAQIFLIDESGLHEIQYEDIESVALLKQFLNHKESFLRHLFTSESKIES